MIAHILEHSYESVAIILFGIGFTMLLLNRNLMKKIIGMNIMDTAIYLFLAAKGYVQGKIAPIITDTVSDTSQFINPIPSGLVLTGIVVSVSVTALLLSLTIRLYERYHTLDIDKIMLLSKKEEL